MPVTGRLPLYFIRSPSCACLGGLTVAGLLALPGCGVVDAVFTEPDMAPAAVVDQQPLPPNRFEIAPGDDAVGALQVITARYEDTFVDIARAYGLGFDELKQANPGVDPWLPGAGTPIILPTRHLLPDAPRRGIVLNLATKRLFYYPPAADGEPVVVETYPIGIGRAGWETPTGVTTVVGKARDPVWFVPRSVREEHAAAGDPLPARVPPGPDNPLGSRALALGLPGYLIHGTNKPAGVGMRVSHGCIRLFPENIEYLYEQVAVGTEVRIVNQPYLIGWQGGELLLEAHPPLEEDQRDWRSGLVQRSRAALVNTRTAADRIDPRRIEAVAAEQRGIPLPILGHGADSAGLLRQARHVRNVVSHERVADSAVD